LVPALRGDKESVYDDKEYEFFDWLKKTFKKLYRKNVKVRVVIERC